MDLPGKLISAEIKACQTDAHPYGWIHLAKTRGTKGFTKQGDTKARAISSSETECPFHCYELVSLVRHLNLS
jgi:hypothetical protein